MAKKIEPKIIWQVGNGAVHEIPEGATVTFESEESTVEVFFYKVKNEDGEMTATRVIREPR